MYTHAHTHVGSTVSADATQDLERGYWPSYNIPYFPSVYNATGYDLLRSHLRSRGPAFDEIITGISYQLAPRAKIMRRDAGAAVCLGMAASAIGHILRQIIVSSTACYG